MKVFCIIFFFCNDEVCVLACVVKERNFVQDLITSVF